MRPESFHTVLIGDALPLIVALAIDHNKEILGKMGIGYTLHRVARDSSFVCPGIQAEFIKIDLLSRFKNIVVCDWDTWIVGVPDFEESKKIFLGYRNDSPDMFVCYYNDERLIYKFEELKHEANKFRVHPGFLKLFSDRLYVENLVSIYPDNSYCHFESMLGLANIRDTWKTVDEKTKFRTEKRCLNNIIKWYRDRGFV